MRRRQFLALVGAATAIWSGRPFAATAPQSERKRVGVLMLYPDSDPQGQMRAAAFRDGLRKVGWIAGRNIDVEIAWGIGDAKWLRSAATQLLSSGVDVIVANGDASAQVMKQLKSSVPVVFIAGADPIAGGLVESLAHPGGDLTGFSVLEPSVGAKQLELLKEVAPRITHVAVLFNADSPGNRQLAAATVDVGPRFGVQVVSAPMRTAGDIETAMAQWGRDLDHGVIVPPDPSIASHRKLIIELAARHRLPVIYALRFMTVEGGLMSYGVDILELFRQTAGYVDRIFKGEKPADLPVQLPTKFELAINMQTAKALGVTVPDKLLALADEVIE
jgi:putative tryptophan/tyrosine transport system substrate-binding protein